MIKKILSVIFEPLKVIGSKGVSEFLWNLLNKNRYIVYTLAFIATALIIFTTYFN